METNRYTYESKFNSIHFEINPGQYLAQNGPFWQIFGQYLIKCLTNICWILPQTKSTQPRVIFLCKTKPQLNRTVRHFFSAPTQLNSTKFSMQPYFNPTRRFMPKKIGSAPPPKKNLNLIWTNSKLNSTKFSMPPYFNLN